MVYKGILKENGRIVEEKDAYAFARRDLRTNKELQKEFAEWYYGCTLDEEEEQDKAYAIAIRNLRRKELQREFVEWYYSGNWIEEEDDENS